MSRRQAPQSPPAPQRRVTSSTSVAPEAMHSLTWESETARHTHSIMVRSLMTILRIVFKWKPAPRPGHSGRRVQVAGLPRFLELSQSTQGRDSLSAAGDFIGGWRRARTPLRVCVAIVHGHAKPEGEDGMRMKGLLAILVLVAAVVPRPAPAASAAEIDRKAAAALRDLYAGNPTAKLLAERAKGILVFPTMVKAGFMFGGQIGEGTLQKQGRSAGYYNSVAASYGFQAGVQSFGYALFFMNEAALQQLDATRGFEVGVGPSIVLVDQGVARTLTTNTLTSDVYAIVFDQKGLMAGVGIQGSKITRVAK